MTENKDHLDYAQETLDALRGLRDLVTPGSHGGYGLTLGEVGKALGVSEATVRSWTGTYHPKVKRFLGGRRLPTGDREAALRRFVAKKFERWRRDLISRSPADSAAAGASK